MNLYGVDYQPQIFSGNVQKVWYNGGMKERIALTYLVGFFLEAPLFCLYTLLGVLLCKEMGLGSLGLMLLCSSKPLVALLSSYWRGSGRQQILQTSLVSALLALSFPWTSQPAPYLLGFALFFLSQRSAIPAWIELLRRHTEERARSRIVAKGALIGYLAAALIPLLIGPLLDSRPKIFPWLFFAASIISLARIPLQYFWLPYQREKQKKRGPWLAHPWKATATLLRNRPDFAAYQLLFFFGGLGLMVMQPTLPRFVTEVLGLSYTEVAFAFAFSKGAGFILATPLATRWFSKTSIFAFSGVVTTLAALSLALMLAASGMTSLIYAGFFCYGIMQAGSHLSWHLAGPHFSGEEDSAPFTSVNVALVGLRGLIGPLLGGLLSVGLGLTAPFWVGIALCLGATALAFRGGHAALRS